MSTVCKPRFLFLSLMVAGMLILVVGCYTMFLHPKLETTEVETFEPRVEHRDDCFRCHGGAFQHHAMFGPEFYSGSDYYAWQWYYDSPWWLDDFYYAHRDEEGSQEIPQARDFSRRHTVASESGYAPSTAGVGTEQTPQAPMSKVAEGSGSEKQQETPNADPRRTISRRETSERARSTDSERQSKDPVQKSEKSEKKTKKE